MKNSRLHLENIALLESALVPSRRRSLLNRECSNVTGSIQGIIFIMPKNTLFIFGLVISFLLLWFAVSDYRAAAPIAADTLKGLALTTTAAIEHGAQQDPSFRSLSGFHPADVAFFAVIDRNGTIRFHSNPDLIGTESHDTEAGEVVRDKAIRESGVLLGTGERAYAFYAPLYARDEVFALRLILHTYRANAVIRRARLNLALLVSFVAAGWVLAAIFYRFVRREEVHRQEMARHEHLARLGEMGATLAHEIRNPLAGIKGYAQVIEKRPADERNRTFAQSIVTETLRLETLVSDLLAYATSDKYAMAEVDFRELVDHTILLVKSEAGLSRITMENACRDGIRVVGNHDRLLQVMLNLAKNAIQAMPDGGRLSFSAGKSDRHARITVSDTGEGISSDLMRSIFEPFFTTKARGTGLGLALCKKIIAEHEGTLAVESGEGTGTNVTITLPLSEGEGKKGRGK